ncbi:MAG: exo-alpha-sialidase [Verrucomicrobia bacterium]|nr:exo-alpha-sialidase [Verrucomicrobiota bacterium]
MVVRASAADEKPFHSAELLFPLEAWHNHGSCIVETAAGDLLVCWFHGSGERKADDVIIEGARLRRGEKTWSARFQLADTPGYPDGNPCMTLGPDGRLWLFYTTILAHTWESALLKVRTSRDYAGDRAPRWETSEVVHVTPGAEFEAAVARRLPELETALKQLPLTDKQRKESGEFLDAMRRHTGDELYRRLGWMTRAHPVWLDGGRLIVPLYHDGFSFSLMAFTDDGGRTWRTSTPLIGAGNIQPSLVARRDGSLVAYMRDNGPPPHRVQASESPDRGETWSTVVDLDLPNPGAGTDLIKLRNGHWVFIGNDTEQGRHSLAVKISDDEGHTWKWTRHLERDAPGAAAGSYHYPSIIQTRDGSLHTSYSYFLSRNAVPKPAGGEPATKAIKHAHFNEAWVQAGDGKQASTEP